MTGKVLGRFLGKSVLLWNLRGSVLVLEGQESKGTGTEEEEELEGAGGEGTWIEWLGEELEVEKAGSTGIEIIKKIVRSRKKWWCRDNNTRGRSKRK